jgi:cell division protein FtsI (penicillin-binding protein 3)
LRITELYRLKEKRYLRGVDLSKRFCRRYPHGTLLGHVLGFVDFEGKGLSGLEKLHDDFLKGRPGSRRFRKDGVQNEIFSGGKLVEQGIPGGNLHLTIDAAIQFFAEMELAKIERLYRPRWAAAVAMEPATGRILAAACIPALDPANPAAGVEDHWINRPLASEYVPGSTFKPLMMAICLDRGVVDLDESIDCEGGFWRIPGRVITDVHVNYRMLNPAGILRKSSNIGISKLAIRLVPDGTPKGSPAFKPIRDTYSLLGFGKRPGLLSENQELKGKLRALSEWTWNYTLVSLAFGNEITVTPVQMAAAMSALANGGTYIPPTLVSRLVNDRGLEIIPPQAPACRVFSEETSRTVRDMMVRVVEEGSGKQARIPGVQVGGKTGTSEKLPARQEVTSSFVAFAPAASPSLLVLVVVDEPQGAHYASKVAAPHVKAILERGLSHLGVLCRSQTAALPKREG